MPIAPVSPILRVRILYRFCVVLQQQEQRRQLFSHTIPLYPLLWRSLRNSFSLFPSLCIAECITTTGMCAMGGAPGDACSTNSPCAIGATCRDGFCKTPLPIGGDCSDKDTTFCEALGQCVLDKCKVPLLGDGCGTLSDNCVAPGECVSNKCKVPLGQSGCDDIDSNCVSGDCNVDVCETPIPLGENCGGTNTYCVTPLASCINDVCVLQVGESVCAKDADCATGLKCQVSSGTCKTPLGLGLTCNSTSTTTFCDPPADCVNNVCVLRCVDTTDCAAGLDCVSGVCQEPSGVEPCTDATDCNQDEFCEIVGGVGTCQPVDGVRRCWARIDKWNFFWKWLICLIKWLWNLLF
jgi:hypothetical protein